MKNRTIRILVVIGAFTLIGLAFVQFYLLKTAFNNRKSVFEQSVQVALFQVVSRLNNNDLSQLPQASPVVKKSSDYYVVDVNRDFDCEILEFYLKSEFEKAGIDYDFEYAIYDCYSDIMVYGNFVSFDDEIFEPVTASEFLKHEEFVYYFAVHFPSIESDILGSLKVWFVFALIFICAMVFVVYAIIVVLGQKRFSELQRTFVNTVSHEFRTPIAASNIAIEYLQRDETIKSNKRLDKYIEMLHLQNFRLNSLIDRLLNLSTSHDSVIELKYEKVDVQELLQDVISVFASNHKEVMFETKGSVDTQFFCIDKFHAGNIFHVIIDNAVKYTARNNKEPKIWVSYFTREKHLLIKISDNGVGIPKNFRKKVFKQFYRIPTGNVHNVKGFGIGLYYVHLLAKKMKWKISIDDGMEGGASFNLEIPVYNRKCK